MEQIIIAMSGRKQAGKNTIAKFIKECYAERMMRSVNLQDEYHSENVLNPFLRNVFECSFADSLKDFCVSVLGLSVESCYGSDEEKNAPTEYSWDDCSPFLAWKFGTRKVIDQKTDKLYRQFMDKRDTEFLRQMFYDKGGREFAQLELNVDLKCMGHRTGVMSGRDIMQVFGTDLIRETFGNVWAKATIRLIKKAGKPLSIITDNRFPNEIKAVLEEPKGYIIRLTRSPFGLEDIHPSEAALDDFDWSERSCFTLDNAKMTIEEQNEAVRPILHEIFEIDIRSCL